MCNLFPCVVVPFQFNFLKRLIPSSTLLVLSFFIWRFARIHIRSVVLFFCCCFCCEEKLLVIWWQRWCRSRRRGIVLKKFSTSLLREKKYPHVCNTHIFPLCIYFTLCISIWKQRVISFVEKITCPCIWIFSIRFSIGLTSYETYDYAKDCDNMVIWYSTTIELSVV